MEHLAQTDTMEHQYESGPENDNEEKPLLGTDQAPCLNFFKFSLKEQPQKEMRFSCVELMSLYLLSDKPLIVLNYTNLSYEQLFWN
jgi:hypothetical protein